MTGSAVAAGAGRHSRPHFEDRASEFFAGAGQCGRCAAVTLRRGAFVLVLLALAPAFRGEAAEPPGDSCPSHLFVLGRSKNANIVVYDANRDPAGDLASSDPVVAYWLLNGESGAREELNLVERQRAYGFDLTPGETPGTFEMAFKAGRSRRLVVASSTDARWQPGRSAVTTESFAGCSSSRRRVLQPGSSTSSSSARTSRPAGLSTRGSFGKAVKDRTRPSGDSPSRGPIRP